MNTDDVPVSIKPKSGDAKDWTKRFRATRRYRLISSEVRKARRAAWRSRRAQRRREMAAEIQGHAQRLRHLKAAYERHSASGNASRALNMKVSAEHVLADIAKIFGSDTAALVQWC